MNPAAPEGKKQSRKHVAYFAIGAFLLLLMAFAWAVDPSLDYILFGAALFFLFLGFWARPRQTSKRQPLNKNAGRSASPAHDLRSVLRDLFQKKTRPASPPSSPTISPKTLVMVVSFFISSVFVIIIVAVIFIESGSDVDDVDFYYQRAEEFRLSEQYDSARLYYRRALSVNAEYAPALNGAAYTWLSLANYDSALYLYNAALAIDPDLSDAWYGKALTYNYRQNYRQSLRETLALMENDPEYSNAMLLTGDNYYMQQRYDSAIYWYENGYDRGERSAALCHVMAYIYDTQGKQERAITLYREALSYDSTRIEIYNRLGELFPGQNGELYRSKARELKEQGY